MASQNPAHLTPSQLGTKEYWDETYSSDLEKHAQDPFYTGTTWFTESLASSKILDYLQSLPLSSYSSFLDLGCGNGELLFQLRLYGGFDGRILGIDYSAQCIKLANRIADTQVLDYHRGREVEFKQWDIMGEEKWMEGEFDLVLDKGTFDAVSLSGEVDGEGRKICEGYRARVEVLMKPGGRFLVTSCNWTEEELRSWFEGEELVYAGRIAYPKFSFGGKTGQSISSVCFRREGG